MSEYLVKTRTENYLVGSIKVIPFLATTKCLGIDRTHVRNSLVPTMHLASSLLLCANTVVLAGQTKERAVVLN